MLAFGDYVLKSGRKSPYFFNLGNLSSGAAVRRMGDAYAERIAAFDPLPDVVFGPAYKGIPIAVAAVAALADRGVEAAFAHDRKEAKEHGEGGLLVGAPLEGRNVVIVDDVVSDGTAKIEASRLIAAAGGRLCGIVLALDRQELVDGRRTAAEALEASLGVPVLSVANLDQVLGFLEGIPRHADQAQRIAEYRQAHCRIG